MFTPGGRSMLIPGGLSMLIPGGLSMVIPGPLSMFIPGGLSMFIPGGRSMFIPDGRSMFIGGGGRSMSTLTNLPGSLAPPLASDRFTLASSPDHESVREETFFPTIFNFPVLNFTLQPAEPGMVDFREATMKNGSLGISSCRCLPPHLLCLSLLLLSLILLSVVAS